MTKLFDTILLSLMVVLLMIGIHQTMVNGFGNSYWIFMFLLGLFFLYNFRKVNNKNQKKG